MGPGPGRQADPARGRPTGRRVQRAIASVRRWQVWTLRPAPRLYVAGVVLAAAGAAAIACTRASWRAPDLALAGALVACAIIANEASRQLDETHGELIRDLGSLWMLPMAVLLPPVYALLAPVPIYAHKIFRLPSVVPYRRVFSGATMSLAYGSASALFHVFPASIAGSHPGDGRHTLTWAFCAAVCWLLAWLINYGLLLIAITLVGPARRLRDLMGRKETVTADGIELTIAVGMALVAAMNWVLVFVALPAVVLCRRSLVRTQWAATARLDAGTGLLNAGTWRREAEFGVSRAARSGGRLAIAMVSVDDFAGEPQQLTVARAVRDQLISQVAATLKDQLPVGALAGRMGDVEFAILLPHAGPAQARHTAERLRDHITATPFAVDTGEASYVFRLTVSAGIALLNESSRALDDLVDAADTALAQARAAGGRVYLAAASAEAS